MGISLKKVVELILAILGLVLHLVSKERSDREQLVFITIIITLVYLSLVIIMACTRRDITGTGSQAIECAAGMMLMVLCIASIVGKRGDGTYIAAMVVDLILAAIFLIVAIF